MFRRYMVDKRRKINTKNWKFPKADIIEFAPRRTRYCVCIPVINEGQRFMKQLSQMKKEASLADILILDGGSTDGSIKNNFLRRNKVRTLLIKKSLGKLSAQLRMGYAYAIREGYDGVITIDGNGKDDPGAIPDFIKKLDFGFDYIQGSRFIEGGKAVNTPPIRYLAIRIIHAPILSLASGFRYSDTTSGFRAYSKRLIGDSRLQLFREVFNTYEMLAYISARVPRLGLRTTETPITRRYPSKGKVPTKIGGLKGNLDIFVILMKVVFGDFNPKT